MDIGIVQPMAIRSIALTIKCYPKFARSYKRYLLSASVAGACLPHAVDDCREQAEAHWESFCGSLQELPDSPIKAHALAGLEKMKTDIDARLASKVSVSEPLPQPHAAP
jgi:hypothetical protein